MSHKFRILIKPHGISRERYQSSRGKLKTRKFLCIRRDAHLLKSCVLSKYYAYITQDARQNESLLEQWLSRRSLKCSNVNRYYTSCLALPRGQNRYPKDNEIHNFVRGRPALHHHAFSFSNIHVVSEKIFLKISQF
jgi:hypothetical protein